MGARPTAPPLLLPADGAPPAALAALRRAYAQLLLKKLAAQDRGPLVARLGPLARSTPDAAVDVLTDPTVSVLIQCDQTAAALSTIAAAFANGPPAAASATFPVIDGPIRLALRDENPLALQEAHPDKQGNALSLGGRDAAEWVAALRSGLALVDDHLPSLSAELRLLLRLVIPVGWEPEKHLSASYREYIGAIYVTLHPDPVTLAEAIVHEFQHNKLNLLSWHYPVLENGYDFLYKSPVRPDPRPLMGILLAAHAFVPVAELYRRMLAARPAGVDLRRVEARLVDVIGRNSEALAVLRAHGVWAPAGAQLLEELGALHATHLALSLSEPAATPSDATHD